MRYQDPLSWRTAEQASRSAPRRLYVAYRHGCASRARHIVPV